jgi:hypothetical protein
MPKLLRSSIALIASYGIALQLLLLGFGWAPHAGFDEIAVICSSDGSGGHGSASDDGSLPQRDDDCGSCPLACAEAAPAVMPATARPSWIVFVEGPRPFAPRLGSAPAGARHEPQEARGPPLG